MKSYEDLQTNLGIARFYGDSIHIIDKNLTIYKEQIKQFKISFFRITLIIINNQKIQIRFNKKLIQWLNPNYFAQILVACIISSMAFLFSFLKLNLQHFWICFFYAILNGFLILLYFRIMRKNFQKSFFILSSLYALLNLPLLLYLPLSRFFWVLFISGYGVFLIVIFFPYKKLFLNKVFLGFIWILLSISTYSWFITILKLSFDSKLEVSLRQEVNFKISQNKILWGETTWKKPIFWNWNTLSSWNSFFLGKEIIFQVQPIKPVILLHTPEQKRLGWLSFSKIPAQELLMFIPFYLENQKNLIWTKLLNSSPVTTIQTSKDKKFPTSYTQSYLFFDFNTNKEVILHFLTTSIETKSGVKSFLWCIKQDTIESMEYILLNILKGMSIEK